MITRQNKERQRNLTHHAEDQHVFAMRHSGVAVLTFFIHLLEYLPEISIDATTGVASYAGGLKGVPNH